MRTLARLKNLLHRLPIEEDLDREVQAYFGLSASPTEHIPSIPRTSLQSGVLAPHHATLAMRDELRPYPRLLDCLRYSCAFLLYMYGVSKLAHLQFHLTPETARRPIGSMTGYELTWYYYGYSRVYACILGLTQVLGATLLLFRKTTLVGAAMMIPVMANILLIDIFILVNDYGPEFMAVFIFSSLLVILWHHRASLLSLFWSQQAAEPPESRLVHHWVRAAIVLSVSTIMLAGLLLMRIVRR